MTRVLRIITRLNIGGPMYNVSYLTKYLAPKYETMLVSGMTEKDEGTTDFLMSHFGIEPYYVKDLFREIQPTKDFRSLHQIRKIIKSFKPDIVHTHTTKAGAIGRLAAHIEKVPVIVHTFHGHIFHSYFGKRKTQVFRQIEKYLAYRTSKIIAISKQQKLELSEEIGVAPADKFEIIPLGFELQKFQEGIDVKRHSFRRKYQLEEDEVAIGIVARMAPIKNHPYFLKAIKILSERTSQKFRAVIIGDGEKRDEIRNLCKELELPYTIHTDEKHDKLVTFTSWIMDMDLATSGLDIIALTSLNEGTPVSLIEASAAGKAIVSTNVGGVRDVVKSEVNAFIVEKTDPEAFAQKLKILVEDKALRLKMGGEGVLHAFKEYSHHKLVENVDNLYDRLMVPYH